MQLALTAARVDQKNFGLWLRSWQVGQMLNALVTAQRPTGDIVLRVAGQQITARADIPVQQGTNLLLEVKQLQPQIVLKIVPQAAQGATGAAPGTGAATGGAESGGLLRLLSPDGAPLATRNVADIAATLRALQTALPPGPGNPAQRLLLSLPGLADLLGAAGLRRAVASSGSFLEAALARASASSPAPAQGDDLKAQLMRVLDRVNTALQRAGGDAAVGARAALLVDARRDLEIALGSITLNQLQSQPGESQGWRGWVFDVPFLLDGRVGNLHMRIEREDTGGDARDSAETAPRWRVELQLDLPRLGPLLLTTSLRAEAIDVELCARERGTQDLLRTRTGELAAALHELGLDVPSLQVTDWRPDPAATAPRQTDPIPTQSWRA